MSRGFLLPMECPCLPLVDRWVLVATVPHHFFVSVKHFSAGIFTPLRKAETLGGSVFTGEDFYAQGEALSGYFVTRNMIRRPFACSGALLLSSSSWS